jgi:two-component system, OmpR family, sensor histidine kinase VanS
MNTIRTKLSLLFSLFMISCVLGGILLNALFLEHYYIYRTKGIFLRTYGRIGVLSLHDRERLDEFLRTTDRDEGINTTMADRNLDMTYSSIPQRVALGRQRLPPEITRLIEANRMTLKRSYVYTIVQRPGHAEREIVFLSELNENEIIVLKKSMRGIDESVAIAHQFYTLAGLVIILMGGMFIYLYSRKITRPVIEMSAVAEEISNLDFDRRVTLDSQDEIGSLARSINRISEKLSAAMNALKEDVEHRKQLVRNMSHELKTPIGVIKGYAEGLKFGVVEDKEKTQKYCSVIAEECDRMDRMVQELLSLSMMESGMSQLNISRVDCEKVIETVLDRFQHAMSEKGITLEVSCQRDLFISADLELMERALNNYITNAMHHTEGQRQIKITAEKKNNEIRISVFNTGTHIPDNDLGNIWDVFYKVDKARTREYGGHGLGLSIVRLIAELHGGITGVENVDQGVLFFIELPATSAQKD